MVFHTTQNHAFFMVSIFYKIWVEMFIMIFWSHIFLLYILLSERINID